jgi:hypothetical protein
MLFLALIGCAPMDKYSFIQRGQTLDATGRLVDFNETPVLSDALALNYASSVATILRCKFNGARISREVSSTAQVALAALAGAGAAFDFGASTVTALSLSSAGIPHLQQIFDAKGRAQVYQDAVRLIEEAEIEYLAHNPRPANNELTPNGVTLFQRVSSCIHVVEKTLAGNLPTIQDMRQVTEPMTPVGALPFQAGDVPPNNISASGIPIRKSELTQIVGRRSGTTILAGGTPPQPNIEITVIPAQLQGRNNALQRSFENLSDSQAAERLMEKDISAAQNPKEILAQNILARAKLEPKAGMTAIQALTQYRQNADTDAKLKRLEDAYRYFQILSSPVAGPLRDRNLVLKASFEGLKDADIQKAISENQITVNPGESAREALAVAILDKADLKTMDNSTATASVTTYRIKANFDLALTEQLESAYRRLGLGQFKR